MSSIGRVTGALVCLLCLIVPSSLAQARDTGEGRWTLLAPLLAPRTGHTVTTLQDGQILAVGGSVLASGAASEAITATVERYDPSSDRWSFAASLGVPRGDHTATLLRDGRVLVVGGFGGQMAHASAEVYDPRVDAWTPAGTLSEPRGNHTATLLPDGRVLVTGGASRTVRADSYDSAEIYDPATNRWSPAAPMSVTRYLHRAVLLRDGRVLVTGGVPNRVDTPLATAEIYDPVTNRWSAVAPMSRWRYRHTLVLLRDGTVLLFGGASVEQDTETYDPVSNSWSPAGDTQTQQPESPGLFLPDGRVLAVGPSPEAYDPTTRRWTTVAPLHVPRGTEAVTLPSGQVMAVGGFKLGDGGGTITGAVERYDPPGLIPNLPKTGGGWSAPKTMVLQIASAMALACLGISGCARIRRRRNPKR
ncbi:MAG: kelch repeat-containing protein [Thermomicrobiales bacterium]